MVSSQVSLKWLLLAAQMLNLSHIRAVFRSLACGVASHQRNDLHEEEYD